MTLASLKAEAGGAQNRTPFRQHTKTQKIFLKKRLVFKGPVRQIAISDPAPSHNETCILSGSLFSGHIQNKSVL